MVTSPTRRLCAVRRGVADAVTRARRLYLACGSRLAYTDSLRAPMSVRTNCGAYSQLPHLVE
ncbi:hypothetical protein K443DRAFT_681369 [Laccaria amethystina LaAM-08-1]|uniref:Uncharacterized protein n=1 Tax=Laccaria amethystina LaAM-08-1 TaxID=1095629 RepID=A0A0C9X8D2_9AGAR|nr:hypothetical protein K443DRAFT_681369 [Laccaria amethystina LaAM-08-1]